MTDAKIGTQYQFRVKAENDIGVSEPSDASDAVTMYGKVKHINSSDCSHGLDKYHSKYL